MPHVRTHETHTRQPRETEEEETMNYKKRIHRLQDQHDLLHAQLNMMDRRLANAEKHIRRLEDTPIAMVFPDGNGIGV